GWASAGRATVTPPVSVVATRPARSARRAGMGELQTSMSPLGTSTQPDPVLLARWWVEDLAEALEEPTLLTRAGERQPRIDHRKPSAGERHVGVVVDTDGDERDPTGSERPRAAGDPRDGAGQRLTPVA